MWDHYFNRPLWTFGLCSTACHHLHSQFLLCLSPTETCCCPERRPQSWKLPSANHQHCLHLFGCVYKDYDCISYAFTTATLWGTAATHLQPPACPAPQVEPDSVLSVKVERGWVVELSRCTLGQEETQTGRLGQQTRFEEALQSVLLNNYVEISNKKNINIPTSICTNQWKHVVATSQYLTKTWGKLCNILTGVMDVRKRVLQNSSCW